MPRKKRRGEKYRAYKTAHPTKRKVRLTGGPPTVWQKARRGKRFERTDAKAGLIRALLRMAGR